MTIINPNVELLEQNDVVSHVARCARVCYDKETGNNDQRLYDDLIKKGHLSVFRHASYYAIVPESADIFDKVSDLDCWYDECPYIDMRWSYTERKWYIATNGNFMLDSKERLVGKVIEKHLVSPEEFANTEVGHSMMRYTFRITTQISTSREINRTSPNNITEMSTRWVDLKNGAICRPHWMTEEEANGWNRNDYKLRAETWKYLHWCEEAFECYEDLITYFNFKQEDARGVLPLDTATKVIYTYSIEEWKRIIELRSDKRAHPNAAIIANMIKKELEELGYDFK